MVNVAPGTHWVSGEAKYTYVDSRWPPQETVRNGDYWSLGDKRPSTSARVDIGGTKWSKSHDYLRSGFRVISTGGTLTRERLVPWGGSIITQSYTLEGEYDSGSFASVIAADKNPYSVHGAPVGIPANTAARLITEMILKAGDRRVSYGEALGESVKTVNHLAHTASTLAKAYLAARKGNWGALPRILGADSRRLRSGKTASARWLEYSYAWMPLASDIYGTAQLFKKGLDRPQIVRAVRRLKDDDYDLSVNSVDTGSFARKVDGVARSSGQCIGHYKINSSSINHMQQLGLINPLEVAWALVPFSFMIDWFLPVQNVLEATTATLGMDFIDGCLTQKTESFAEVTITKVPRFGGSNTWPLMTRGIGYNIQSSGMKRTRLTYVVPLPYYKSPFSTNHVTSALAVLRQLKR